jgi:Mn2+/Fe2+ NRAMP family transporter
MFLVRKGDRLRLRELGPGLVAGAADNDPTTIGTMVVAGATTGFALSWLVILVFPMLASVQVIASQVGLAARSGLQELVRRTYGWGWGLVLLVSVVLVNAVTIAADVKAGAAALGLLFNLPLQWFLVPFAAALLLMLFGGGYDEIVRVLKYVMLIFVSYIVAAFVVHPNWSAVLFATIRPQLSGAADYVQGALAIVGTTLTSYAYIWEEQEEAETEEFRASFDVAEADAGLGMAFSVAVFWFVLIVSGATLGAHHQRVDTAEQAAQALRPLAGPFAAYLFGIGLLASATIAVPVLAATSAYLLCQQLGWPGSLSSPLRRAKRFYAVIAVALLLGMAIALAPISTISLLYVASIAGGLGTPVGLVFLMLIAHRRDTVGGHRIGTPLLALGWATTAVVTAVGAVFVFQQLVH